MFFGVTLIPNFFRFTFSLPEENLQITQTSWQLAMAQLSRFRFSVILINFGSLLNPKESWFHFFLSFPYKKLFVHRTTELKISKLNAMEKEVWTWKFPSRIDFSRTGMSSSGVHSVFFASDCAQTGSACDLICFQFPWGLQNMFECMRAANPSHKRRPLKIFSFLFSLRMWKDGMPKGMRHDSPSSSLLSSAFPHANVQEKYFHSAVNANRRELWKQLYDNEEEKWATNIKQIEFDFPSFVFEYEINWNRM